MEIINVNGNEIEELQQVSKQTFYETFADVNTAENMQKFLQEAYAIDKLRTEMQNPDSAFYFARHDGNVIGYLKINVGPSQTELKDSDSLEIERIYVLKEYHGMKVGQMLYEKALDIAREKNCQYLWLGVWEKNARAISFYKKNGFVEFGQHEFILGDDVQTDIMMRLAIE
jgi:ribosomal protein S18 acetylase RimI-like enzyme